MWFALIDTEPSRIESETARIESETSTISSESGSNACASDNNVAEEGLFKIKESDREWTLLDLYSGCGAMSTGLCFGASIADIKLVTVFRLICIMFHWFIGTLLVKIFFTDFIILFLTLKRWAVDINEYACQSLKLNHPETQVCFGVIL